MKTIIIGSGPAGVSAATALLARGRKVIMLDGGKDLETFNKERRDFLTSHDPAKWTEVQRSNWMAPQYDTPPGQVRRYGSDFAMESAQSTFSEVPDWFSLRASHAVGGLSNLWGSAILPYRQGDISDWPISSDDLAPHYRAVAAFMPVAASSDALDTLFPSVCGLSNGKIQPSTQAEYLLANLSARRDALAALGVTVGRARQAVDPGCRRCGMCLHGCPYGLIWSARDTVADLRKHPDFSYRSGAVVRRFSEGPNGVSLQLADGSSIDGDRVFLAAGVLESARIVLTSGNRHDTLSLKDSQHAFLPMIQRWRNRQRPDRGAFHTLPQIFAEMDAPDISPRSVHAQIYTWNEHFARDLNANYGRRLPVAKPLLTALARHLIVAQLFLHSDQSHSIGLELADDGKLAARLIANDNTDAILKKVTQRMAGAMSKVGLSALTFASRPGAPGSSFHAGSTVPMAKAPFKGTSDVLGRPFGLQRIHVVDASVLPSIPATTITFSVMANAHRIASLAP